jgi:hypothetical protein
MWLLHYFQCMGYETPMARLSKWVVTAPERAQRPGGDQPCLTCNTTVSPAEGVWLPVERRVACSEECAAEEWARQQW